MVIHVNAVDGSESAVGVNACKLDSRSKVNTATATTTTDNHNNNRVTKKGRAISVDPLAVEWKTRRLSRGDR